jgi:hypothetical protein
MGTPPQPPPGNPIQRDPFTGHPQGHPLHGAVFKGIPPGYLLPETPQMGLNRNTSWEPPRVPQRLKPSAYPMEGTSSSGLLQGAPSIVTIPGEHLEGTPQWNPSTGHHPGDPHPMYLPGDPRGTPSRGPLEGTPSGGPHYGAPSRGPPRNTFR